MKLPLNQGETDSVEIGRGDKQGCCMSSISFNLYGESLLQEALSESVNLKIGGMIINKVGFADDAAIIVEIEEELQDMMNRLFDPQRKCGMENKHRQITSSEGIKEKWIIEY